MTLWLSPAVGKRASSDVAAASLRMQTVAIGDIPYIPASPTTDRQPKMNLQSHCPSLGCEGVAGGSRLLVLITWCAVTVRVPAVPTANAGFTVEPFPGVMGWDVPRVPHLKTVKAGRLRSA